MKQHPNIVVGGGIIGLLTAWYLNRAGKSTLLIEKGRIGQESSWAGGGILSPLYPDRYPSIAALVDQSRRAYPGLVRELRTLCDIDPELIASEILVLDAKTKTIGTLIEPDALAAMEPNLRSPIGGAIAFPAGQVRNPRMLALLKCSLAALGIELSEGEEAVGFAVEAGRLIGLKTSRRSLNVDNCVVAAGAWTAKLLQGAGLNLKIRPIRGQMIVFAARPQLISRIIVHEYCYLIPRADGRILVGSTVEDVGFDKATTAIAREKLRHAAIGLVPLLESCPIEHHWAGLRPGSPDDAPLIGEHPAIKGLFVCAGHHRNGFATAPASAQLVVDMLLGRAPQIAHASYALDRPMPEWGPAASIK